MSVLTDNDDGTNKHISQLRHQLLEAIGYCFDWAEGETFTWASDEFLGLFVKIGKTAEKALEDIRKWREDARDSR